MIFAHRLSICWTYCLFTIVGAHAQEGLQTALAGHHYREALQISEAEILHHPSEPKLWLAKGIALDGLGRTTESFDSFDHALSLDPAYLPAAEASAQIAYRSHDPRASRYLDIILKTQPENPVANAMEGVLAFEKRDCPAAIKHLRSAGDIAHKYPQAEMQLAICLERTGETAKATEIFESLHQGSLDDSTIACDLASTYIEAKRFRDAIQLLTTQRSGGRQLNSDAMNLLASAYAGNDQIVEAIDTYRAAIIAHPQDERHYIDLAILSMDHQSPAVALGVLDAGIKNNPHSGALYTMRGSIYAQIAKNDEAQSDFEMADRLAPSEMFGTIGLGVLLRDESNLDQAQTILKDKLIVKPDDPILNYMLADILIRKGAVPGQPSFTEAEQLLKSAVTRKPELAQAHAELGKLLIKDGRLPAAIAQLELAIRSDPTDRTALNQLVAAYRRSGRTEDAARVAGQLAQAVGKERAEETEKNRVHLIMDAHANPSVLPASRPD